MNPGDSLGPYRILDKLGEGGMGQVYKARDTRLDRLVAIKQSATEFSDRFEHEARAVAALNHPNICQLYDVGPDYLVMEFLDGRPLAAVEGTRKVLDLAVQIADGMAAAHAAGIVHRDLKPDNIVVTADGRVKILDFGIAKAITGDAGEQYTRAAITGAGAAIGTVHYMSPEQARGLATIGPQSDQFSFGLILYELVTGQKAFARESSAETLTAIIREDAAPLPASVPAPLRWIIERLLAKDPAERYDSSRDLYRELKQLRDRLSDATAPVSGVTSASHAAPMARSRNSRWLPVFAAVALAAATGGLTWALTPRVGPYGIDLSAYQFTPLSQDAATEREPAWSPDGRTLAYTATVDGLTQLMVREVGAATAAQITRGELGGTAPFWAPDGSRVYFTRGGALLSVSAVGGEPEMVIDGATSAALHPRDGRFVFARGSRLWVLDPASSGGNTEPQPFGQTPFQGSITVHRFSPDGTTLPIVQDGALWLLAYPGGATRPLSVDGLRPGGAIAWMPDSRRFITDTRDSRGPSLSIFDIDTSTIRTILRAPRPLLNPSVSPDGGRLAFVTGDSGWKLIEVSLDDGRVRQLESGGLGGVPWFPTLSPDGTRLAYALNGRGLSTIREMNVASAGQAAIRTIFTETGDETLTFQQVEWSPDGTRILFWANSPSGGRVMVVPAAGGRALPLDTNADSSFYGVWSPDGTRIVYRRRIGDEQQIAVVRVGTSTAPVAVRRWSVNDGNDQNRLPVAWSPDGEWLLTIGGRNVFLMAADGSQERELSSSTGSVSTFRARPIFSRDGREVLMLRRDAAAPGRPWTLFAIDVGSGRERVVTTVDLPRTGDDLAGLSISPDGKRLYTSFADWPFDIWMLEGFQ